MLQKICTKFIQLTFFRTNAVTAAMDPKGIRTPGGYLVVFVITSFLVLQKSVHRMLSTANPRSTPTPP